MSNCVAQNLRDLVYDPEGEAVAAKLISILITQQLDNVAAVSAAAGAVPVPGVCEMCVRVRACARIRFKFCLYHLNVAAVSAAALCV